MAINRAYVYIEVDAKGVRRTVRQALTAAAVIAPGAEIIAVVASAKGDADAAAASMLKVAKVVQADAAVASSQAAAKAIAQIVKAQGPGVVVFGNTSLGREVAPCLAQELGLPLVPDVTSAQVVGDHVEFVRPIYAGKAMAKVKPLAETFVVTTRANAFLDNNESGAAPVEKATVALTADDQKAKVVSLVQRDTTKIELTEADAIVSGGMGLGKAEGFKQVEALADALRAAVGASRAAVNAGWVDHTQQVGQTGKTVSPTLYVALGISGAIQHQAGMSSSKCIVAVNKDPEAPIFQVADYGIVADLYSVVPLLTEEIKKVK
ncbi:MAG TPA: electron transfer flavoprotein subunit alpha/FixB family protein [Candidatus Brocadiia bacterium]|nr:electron transfer flavoprotein subunit alpha/FixB family protein [Candidatus Brocadiia bacterium]